MILFWWFGSFDGLRTNGAWLVHRPSASQHDPFALSLSKGFQPAVVVWILRQAQDERDFLVKANLICAGSFDGLRTNGGWLVLRPSANQHDPFALSLSKGSTCGGGLGPSTGLGRTGFFWCARTGSLVHRPSASQYDPFALSLSKGST